MELRGAAPKHRRTRHAHRRPLELRGSSMHDAPGIAYAAKWFHQFGRIALDLDYPFVRKLVLNLKPHITYVSAARRSYPDRAIVLLQHLKPAAFTQPLTYVDAPSGATVQGFSLVTKATAPTGPLTITASTVGPAR